MKKHVIHVSVLMSILSSFQAYTALTDLSINRQLHNTNQNSIKDLPDGVKVFISCLTQEPNEDFQKFLGYGFDDEETLWLYNNSQKHQTVGNEMCCVENNDATNLTKEVAIIDQGELNNQEEIAQKIRLRNAVNQQDENTGNTLLHEAVLEGDLQTVQELMDIPADKNIANKDYCTPLDLVANKHFDLDDETEKARCVEIFKALVDLKNLENNDIFYAAVRSGNMNLVELFINAGIASDVRRRAVDYARYGKMQKYLLKNL